MLCFPCASVKQPTFSPLLSFPWPPDFSSQSPSWHSILLQPQFFCERTTLIALPCCTCVRFHLCRTDCRHSGQSQQRTWQVSFRPWGFVAPCRWRRCRQRIQYSPDNLYFASRTFGRNLECHCWSEALRCQYFQSYFKGQELYQQCFAALRLP